MPTSLMGALFPSSSFGERPVVILDGGMGTTLQAPPFELGLDSALWSSELLTTDTGKATLTSLHSLWIDSGAELLGSCTYQSSLPMFLNPSTPSYTPSDLTAARETMNAALPVITSASLPRPERLAKGAVASLSLGPFGAQLQPGQEYAGLYPAPFGTRPTPSKLGYPETAGAACPPLPLEWMGDSLDKEEDHLAAWHLQRLEDFATSPSFEQMGVLAFETTPLIREARAIRRAVSMFDLAREGEGKLAKPFYISFVFPLNEEGNPRFPDAVLEGLGLAEQCARVVEACFAEKEALAMPSGLGVNCTSPVHLGGVVEELSKAMQGVLGEREERPWLVLYPDGGSVYDVVTRTWSTPTGMSTPLWAQLNTSTVKAALAHSTEAGASVWGGVIAGGCCKAGPEAIKALREECVKEGLI